MKYVIIGDLHCRLSKYSVNIDNIPEQLFYPLHNLKLAAELAKKEGAILIVAGDVNDSKRMVHQQVITKVSETIMEVHNMVETYFLLGNHDFETNNDEVYSYLLNLPINLAKPKEPIINNEFALVSYSFDKEQLIDDLKTAISNNPKLIVSHFGLLEGKLSGSEYRTGEFSIKDLKGLENTWIILGHYHKPQEITNRIYYVGSPTPVNISEFNENKRILLLDTQTNEIKSIPTIYPKTHFQDLTMQDVVDTNNIIQTIKDSYDKYIFKMDKNHKQFKILKKLSIEYPGYIYIKENQSENIIDDTEINFESFKIDTVFNEFLDKSNVSNDKKDTYLHVGINILNQR